MKTIEAIAQRRSIRKFKSDPIPDEAVEAILEAGIQAPSGKNKQPWLFMVINEDKRAEMVEVMREAIEQRKADDWDIGSSEGTAASMEQAPLTIFVYYPEGSDPWLLRSIDEEFTSLVDIQSIGAAIQNMILAATDLGLGSLWICDVFYAYEELRDWMGGVGELVAAVSFGYPDESPEARPRKDMDEVVVRL